VATAKEVGNEKDQAVRKKDQAVRKKDQWTKASDQEERNQGTE